MNWFRWQKTPIISIARLKWAYTVSVMMMYGSLTAAMTKDAGRKVQKILEAQGWKLTAIINTHSNADHIGGNTLLQNRLNCAVYSTPMENAVH